MLTRNWLVTEPTYSIGYGADTELGVLEHGTPITRIDERTALGRALGRNAPDHKGEEGREQKERDHGPLPSPTSAAAKRVRTSAVRRTPRSVGIQRRRRERASQRVSSRAFQR